MLRFYLDTNICEIGSTHDLSEDEAHHANKVMRLKVGTEIEVFDGCGNLSVAEIISIEKKTVIIQIKSTSYRERITPCVAVAFCPPKGKRCLATVEQMVELGVDIIIPLEAERGVARGGDIAKWSARSISACKQSKRLYLPKIAEMVDVGAMVGEFSKYDKVFVASPGNKIIDGNEFSQKVLIAKSILWLVGPEGGFTDEEETNLLTNGAERITFSLNTLRIGTAASFCSGITRFFS